APETPPPAPEDTPTRQIAPQPLPFSFRWGPERLGLIRYNRVEGLSVGVHAAALPLWHGSPVRIALTARLGSSGPLPSGRLELERVTLRNRVGLSVFGEVAAIDPAADPLGPVSSMLALVAGRDDGDYHR